MQPRRSSSQRSVRRGMIVSHHSQRQEETGASIDPARVARENGEVFFLISYVNTLLECVYSTNLVEFGVTVWRAHTGVGGQERYR